MSSQVMKANQEPLRPTLLKRLSALLKKAVLSFFQLIFFVILMLGFAVLSLLEWLTVMYVELRDRLFKKKPGE